MSQFRHKWRITWDDKTYDITTTARDLAAMQLSLDTDGPVLSPVQMMLVFHRAMLRLEIEGIPSDPDAFLDKMDDFDDMEPGTPLVMDPTLRAPSVG